MSDLARMIDYARAFEVAHLTDDFTTLEACFAPDAAHEVEALAPLGASHTGREAVIAGLRASVHGLDRRFDLRVPEILEGPEPREEGVWMRFGLRLRRVGLPDLRFEGEHLTVFDREGRILRIEERVLDGGDRRVAAYLAEHDEALRSEGAPPSPPREDDLEVLRDALQRSLVRAYGAAKSHQDVEGALAVCHPSFVIDTIPFGIVTRDRVDTEAQLGLFFSIFPDYQALGPDVIADAGGAAWWGRISLTFGGPLLGHAPTGRRAVLPATSIFEFRDGMISREQFEFDLGTLCEGIGLPIGELSETLAGLRAQAA